MPGSLRLPFPWFTLRCKLGGCHSSTHPLFPLSAFASVSEPATSSNANPRHVAIIMDGNGRWARERGLPRIEGHRQGVENVRRIVGIARELGLPYVTLYAFSVENWRRPAEEVGALASESVCVWSAYVLLITMTVTALSEVRKAP